MTSFARNVSNSFGTLVVLFGLKLVGTLSDFSVMTELLVFKINEP